MVNTILAKHGIIETIDKSQIRFNADYIGNIININDKKLSELIFEKIYPTPDINIFSHYTKFDNGFSIIDKSEFRLFNLLKNFKYDEFSLFYKKHSIKGYEQYSNSFGISTGYKKIMSEIFALSLTSEENTAPELWDFFADKGTGIKLTFEIKSHIPDFRQVYYSDKPIDLLKDLFDNIYNTYHFPFNFSYISKIGAFYIKGNYKNEQEFRFLIKRNSDSYNAYQLQPVIFQDDISYITLPFESEFANFKLIKVEKGPNCDYSVFYKIIPIINSKHKNVEIINHNQAIK